MKLYATTTSERASKSQGGNDYLKIVLRDETQQCFAHITVKPTKVIEFSFIKDWAVFPDACEWIGTNDDIKAEKKKTECGCAYHDENGNCTEIPS